MGKISEVTEGSAEEGIKPKGVIGVFLPLDRWDEIIFWKYQHTERVGGLSRVHTQHIPW